MHRERSLITLSKSEEEVDLASYKPSWHDFREDFKLFVMFVHLCVLLAIADDYDYKRYPNANKFKLIYFMINVFKSHFDYVSNWLGV